MSTLGSSSQPARVSTSCATARTGRSAVDDEVEEIVRRGVAHDLLRALNVPLQGAPDFTACKPLRDRGERHLEPCDLDVRAG